MWNLLLILFYTFTFISILPCAPLEKDSVYRTELENDDPELTPGYFQGDILLMEEEQRNGLRQEVFRWPNNTVLYSIHDGFDDEHLFYINHAMETIESVSCIRFKEVSKDSPYFVNITNERGGCYSAVGFKNKIQNLNLQIYPLDVGCFRIGSIMHEILHTIGFYHMQSTWNRDDYVRIIKENIIETHFHNFKIEDKTKIDDFDVEYDYASILHYSAYAFTVNGEKTIIALNENAQSEIMGQRRQLRKSDIDKLNIMYRCPLLI